MSSHKEESKSKIVVFEDFRLTLREDGIFQVHHLADIEDLKEMTIRATPTAIDLCGDQKRPCLYTYHEMLLPDKDARAWFAKEEAAPFSKADAFIVDCLALRMVGNFYLNFDKPFRPTKMFDTEENAVVWLKTFL